MGVGQTRLYIFVGGEVIAKEGTAIKKKSNRGVSGKIIIVPVTYSYCKRALVNHAPDLDLLNCNRYLVLSSLLSIGVGFNSSVD